MRILLLTVGTVNYNCDINFYDPLKYLYKDIIYYNYFKRIREVGRRTMNMEVRELLAKLKPEFVWFHAHNKEISLITLKDAKSLGSKVIVWFSDDQWRFDNFSKYLLNYIDYPITTDENALEKYRKLGSNAIHCQWGSNPRFYRKFDSKQDYDVSFVGGRYGVRDPFINFLRQSGVDVKTFGRGWGKYIDFDDLVKVFSKSKINLNISASSFDPDIKQIKGRIFEIPMSGGFLLTDYVEHLEKYFEIGKEIVCYENELDAVNKIKYYLKHDDERLEIAERGYRAAHARHTWDVRFRGLFKEIEKLERNGLQQSKHHKTFYSTTLLMENTRLQTVIWELQGIFSEVNFNIKRKIESNFPKIYSLLQRFKKSILVVKDRLFV